MVPQPYKTQMHQKIGTFIEAHTVPSKVVQAHAPDETE